MKISKHADRILQMVSLYRREMYIGLDADDIIALKELKNLKIPLKKEICSKRRYCSVCRKKKYICDMIEHKRKRKARGSRNHKIYYICKECKNVTIW